MTCPKDPAHHGPEKGVPTMADSARSAAVQSTFAGRTNELPSLTRGTAITAALIRISLGLLYLWAFVSQGFGIVYSNTNGAKPPS